MVSPRWFVLFSIPILLFVFIHFHCCYKPSVSIHMVDERRGYLFDVFLGFRGLNAHFGFTDHLHRALVQAGIRIFRDDLSIEPGDNIESEIRKAISNSSVYIIVISSAHVSPVFLDELVLMVQQRKASDHLVLPIFYHVHPSIVEFQTGPFFPAFVDREQDLEVARNKRKEALILAANPGGSFLFPLGDDAVAKWQEHLLQLASRLKKEAEDINQQLFKWKEALHDIAGLKPVLVDEDSHESEAVKLIVGRVVKHITTKQSLSNALLGISHEAELSEWTSR